MGNLLFVHIPCEDSSICKYQHNTISIHFINHLDVMKIVMLSPFSNNSNPKKVKSILSPICRFALSGYGILNNVCKEQIFGGRVDICSSKVWVLFTGARLVSMKRATS